jgi:tetratricopeptide (TPR) repeat protein
MEYFSHSRRLHGSFLHAAIVSMTAVCAGVLWPVCPAACAEAPHNDRMIGAMPFPAPEFTLDDFAPATDSPPHIPFEASSAMRPPLEVAIQRSAVAPAIVDVRPISLSSSGWEPPETNDRQVNMTAQLADGHIRRGFDLGCRGALFSARSEFIQALRMLAQAHDTAEGGNVHTNSLAAGMRALEEAEDFIPRGTRLEANIDLEAVVAAHQAPALKSAPSGEIRSMSTRMALECYANYARGHLSHAAGRLPAGSMALYGLGKVYAALGDTKSDDRKLNEYRAMTLFQASLGSDINNPLAANELGVLMARNGYYETARDLLQHSVELQPQPIVWRNLAMVHQRMGQMSAAQQAGQQSQIAPQHANVGSPYAALAAPSVNLVDPQLFSQTQSPSAQEDPALVTEPDEAISDVDIFGAPPLDVATPRLPIPYVVSPRAHSAAAQPTFRIGK